MRLVAARGLVEHDQVLLHHGAHLVDDLLPMLLHPHCGRVPAQNKNGPMRSLEVSGSRPMETFLAACADSVITADQ